VRKVSMEITVLVSKIGVLGSFQPRPMPPRPLETPSIAAD
jgi:hypothetical protein